MKTYNTICGIICIVLFIAALYVASLHKTEEPTKSTKATTTMQRTVKANEPQPQIRYQLTEYERAIVERVVMTESGGEPFNGQMAVAQCILNTAEATGKRPDAVVLEPGQYAPPASASIVTDSIRQAVSAVFDHGQTVTSEPIRYFYAPKYSKGRWHESALQHVITIGGHKFFKIPN